MRFIISLSALLLAACGGSSSGGGDGIPALPKPNGEPVFERYQFLGDEQAMVLDEQTQLVWQRCVIGQTWNATLGACEGVASEYVWQDAMAYGRSQLDTSGFRLPTAAELASLVYCSDRHQTWPQVGTDIEGQACGGDAVSPTLQSAVFPSMEQRTYWTSSSSPGSSTDTKRGVNFASGFISDANSPQASYPIVLVREVDPES